MFISDERPKSFAALGHVKEIASGWDHREDHLDDSTAEIVKWDFESAFRFELELDSRFVFSWLLRISFPCPLGSPFTIDNLGSKAGRGGNRRPS